MQKEIILKQPSGKSNAALDLHTLFSALPIIFRESVCEECNWSNPTFYRKIRTKDMADTGNPNRIIRTISKAEREKIIEIGIKLFEKTGMYLNNYGNTTALSNQ